MKSILEKILVILIGIQIFLQFMGLEYFSEKGNPIILNISLFISVFAGIILLVKIIIKELSLNEKVKSIEYFRTLDIKEIKPIEAGILTKKSKLGFNSVLIIVLDLIEKNIIENKYINNKMYIKLKNNITLEEIQKLSEEEKKLLKLSSQEQMIKTSMKLKKLLIISKMILVKINI